MYRLRLFGWEIASLELEPEEAPLEIGGGMSHNYERDLEPFDPHDRGDWEHEDRKFGFS